MNNFIVAGLSICALSTLANAAIIAPGTYPLRNHPNGFLDPPPYGLRLDELYDARPHDHDQFTFDFDHALSNMQLTYDGTTIRIFGTCYGGWDIGGTWNNDAYLGVYTIDFTYRDNVIPFPSDDDLYVIPMSANNNGTILTPLGHTKILTEHPLGGPTDSHTFQLGNEVDDLGFNGYPGISGWGWLSVDGIHTPDQDWTFIIIPTPGTLVLGLMGLATLRRRR